MAEQYRSLMARYQAGDAAAFESLYCQLAPELRRLLAARAADRSGSDEILEQIFLELHRARGSYDPRNAFEPWLMAVVNHVVQRRRRRRRNPSIARFLGRMVALRPAAAPLSATSLLGLGAGDVHTGGPRG